MPPNIASDENISSLIKAIDPQLQQLSSASIEPLILARIDELPDPVLDLLAWQLHVDFYDLEATIPRRREAVKTSILWHMHKGTEWAIHEALRLIDVKADFVPWWKDNSDPYTFKLQAIVCGDFYRTDGKDKLQSSIRRAVSDSKAARSYMSKLDTRIEFHEAPKLYAGTATLEARDISLGVDLPEMQELLLRFEARILSRIDRYEANLLAQMNAKQMELNLQLEEIKEMLRWKGDDDPLI